MYFAKIALRNIPRRKLRNSLTVLGIVIGVALLVGVNIAAESPFVEFKSYIEAVGGKIDIVVTTVSGSAFEQRKVGSSVAGSGKPTILNWQVPWIDQPLGRL